MTAAGPVASPSTPSATDPAKAPAIVMVVAAALILIAILSKSWITGDKGSTGIHFGPLGAEACRGDICMPVPGKLKIPGDVELFQTLSLIAGFAAAAAAGACGGLVLAGKRAKVPPAKLVNAAFGLAAFSMTFFVIRMLGEGHGVSIGWASFPGIGGVILAGVMLRKLIPLLGTAGPAMPQQPMMGQPMMGQQQPMQQQQPMMQQQQPMMGQPPMQATMCPRCGAPLDFVAQYQRWFCPREQQYV